MKKPIAALVLVAFLVVACLIYWGWGTYQANKRLTDTQAFQFFGYCTSMADLANPQIPSKNEITDCRRFFEEYLPLKTAGYRPGMKPEISLSGSEIAKTYAGVNRRFTRLSERQLKPLVEITNGWLGAP